MAKCHEVRLGADMFSTVTEQNNIILKIDGITNGDFILFKKVDTQTDTDTGLFLMTQVNRVFSNEGLKEGYTMISYNKLS